MKQRTTSTSCPACGNFLHERPARNALSRADNQTYICSTCGQREALLIGTGKDRWGHRLCLYFDEVSGVMLVTEDEPGYTPFGSVDGAPQDSAAARAFCDAWNAKLGLEPDDVTAIVASSMFGRWAGFGQGARS